MNFGAALLQAGWTILNPRQAYAAHKAMNEYRKEHPICELTGSKNGVQIHHIVPIWENPALAADKNNMIALSSKANIHLMAHNGNFGKYYVSNIKEICKKCRAILEEAIVVTRPLDDISESSESFSSRILKWFKRS